jgi:uncharacterized protein YpmB
LCKKNEKIIFKQTKKIYIMLNLIISILLSLGLIFSPEQYQNATEQEKQELQERAKIVDDDVLG